MAVCRDLRLRAAKIGDQEALARERRKRSQWEWENALRRHNFVGFIGEVFKGVVGQKLEKSEFEAWVEEAKRATEKRTEERKAKQKEDAAEQGTNG